MAQSMECRRAMRGQSILEMMLITGLVVIALVAALLAFRGAVSGFIARVTAWISGDPAETGKAPDPPSAAPAKPPPDPPSKLDDDLAKRLQGAWCLNGDRSRTLTLRRTGPGEINGTRLEARTPSVAVTPDGHYYTLGFSSVMSMGDLQKQGFAGSETTSWTRCGP